MERLAIGQPRRQALTISAPTRGTRIAILDKKEVLDELSAQANAQASMEFAPKSNGNFAEKRQGRQLIPVLSLKDQHRKSDGVMIASGRSWSQSRNCDLKK